MKRILKDFDFSIPIDVIDNTGTMPAKIKKMIEDRAVVEIIAFLARIATELGENRIEISQEDQ